MIRLFVDNALGPIWWSGGLWVARSCLELFTIVWMRTLLLGMNYFNPFFRYGTATDLLNVTECIAKPLLPLTGFAHFEGVYFLAHNVVLLGLRGYRRIWLDTNLSRDVCFRLEPSGFVWSDFVAFGAFS